jgi:hypothetical protein
LKVISIVHQLRTRLRGRKRIKTAKGWKGLQKTVIREVGGSLAKHEDVFKVRKLAAAVGCHRGANKRYVPKSTGEIDSIEKCIER